MISQKSGRSKNKEWKMMPVVFLAVLFFTAWATAGTAPGNSTAKDVEDKSVSGQKETAGPSQPDSPDVLVYVYGQEDLLPLFRGQVEAGLFDKELDCFSVEHVPELRRQMTLGRDEIKWYDIRKLVPRNRAHILVRADIQDSGAMMLKYQDRKTLMQSAVFTIRAIDLDTGRPAGPPQTGQFRYTVLNMEEEMRRAVLPKVGILGRGIKSFWAARPNN